MSRTLFENSKAALAFAGMTIVGAVMMVGSADSGGVLDRAASLSARPEPIAELAPVVQDGESQPAEQPIDPAAGWGSSSAVFGEYDADPAGTDSSDPVPTSNPGGKRPSSRADEPARMPGPQPVVSDNEGIPVP